MKKIVQICDVVGTLMALGDDGSIWHWVGNEGKWDRFPVDGLECQKQKRSGKAASAEPNIAFDAFWNAYNYKENRALAEKAWLKLSDGERENAMKSVANYVARTHTDGTFPSRAHPSTWLNQRRWCDEVSAVSFIDEIEEDVL